MAMQNRKPEPSSGGDELMYSILWLLYDLHERNGPTRSLSLKMIAEVFGLAPRDRKFTSAVEDLLAGKFVEIAEGKFRITNSGKEEAFVHFANSAPEVHLLPVLRALRKSDNCATQSTLVNELETMPVGTIVFALRMLRSKGCVTGHDKVFFLTESGKNFAKELELLNNRRATVVYPTDDDD